MEQLRPLHSLPGSIRRKKSGHGPRNRDPSNSFPFFLLGTIAVLMTSFVIAGAIVRFLTLPDRLESSYQVVMRSPNGIRTSSVRYQKYRSLERLLSASDQLLDHRDAKARTMWPPEIWVMRADQDSDELERRIDIDCAGTLDFPKITPNFQINSGDRVFVDYGGKD